MLKKRVQRILKEISQVLQRVDEREVKAFIKQLDEGRTIITCGAGRVGMALRGFTMRLGHLGYKAYMIGDVTVPAISKRDVLLVASGSGETQTIYDLVAIAKQRKAKIALVTGNPASRMGKLADTIVTISAPSKTKKVKGIKSVQPMTTLNEQSLGIFFDAVVLELMAHTKESEEKMWARHSNLE